MKYILNFFVGFFLFLVFLASSYALLNDQVFQMHDYVHVARIVEMNKALREGQFPVRWSANFGFGYGMPLFQFYAPLPYYVGTFFYSLGFSGIVSMKLLILFINVGTIIGSYQLGKKLFGGFAGVLIATLYTLAPYRAVNIFVRGALSEAFGMMILPFFLLGIVMVIKKEKHGFLVLTVSIASLILSHNLTAFIFLPFSLIFGLCNFFYYQFDFKKNSLFDKENLFIYAKVATAYILGLGISLHYLVPAFLEKDYTRLERAIVGGYFDYNLHFLYIRQFFNDRWAYGGSIWGPFDDISFYLGTAQILAVGFAFILFIYSFFKKPKLNKNHFYVASFGILFLLAIFMTLLKSKFIWDNVSLLAFIQFPWRFLSVSSLFFSLLAGSMMLWIDNKKYKLLVVILVLAIGTYEAPKFFKPFKYMDNPLALYYEDQQKISEDMSGILPDYIPNQFDEVVIDPVPTLDQHFYCETSGEDCKMSYEVWVNRAHEKMYNVKLSQDNQVFFNIADFPGWTVYVDNKRVEKVVSDFGLVGLEVSKGDHIVSVRLESTPIRYHSDLLSVISVFSFIILLVYTYVEPKQTRN